MSRRRNRALGVCADKGSGWEAKANSSGGDCPRSARCGGFPPARCHSLARRFLDQGGEDILEGHGLARGMK